MATAKKHMERSHRSYHNPKPFADFESKARFKAYQEEQKSFFGRLASLFSMKRS